jgi:two-component system response regulator AlgR
MHILLVDDEPLARQRLQTLLSDCAAVPGAPPVTMVYEAASADAALALLAGAPVDLVLLDIHMPGTDGLSLARSLRTRPRPPAVVFVTASAGHAVTAFELDAIDYLTKPVRLERLVQALQKAARGQAHEGASETGLPPHDALVIQERGRMVRVPVAEVLYFKAELKYVTVRTRAASHILDGSLSDLEARFGARFLRVHRNALVARHAIRALEKHYFDSEDGESWAVRLHGLAELLPVSRRQAAAVREALAG